MVRKTLSFFVIACFLGILAGCYGASIETQCRQCKDAKGDRTEGAEWTAEYATYKYQCKLEEGKIKVQQGSTWKICD